MKKFLSIIAILVLAVSPVFAAEVMPPAPSRYFNDYANVISAGTEQTLNSQLEQFERETSSQVVVAVFPKMQSDSSIEDYVHRMFQAWKIGQKDRNNGVLLAVFIQDRAMRIEVGYGLEGAIPDAIAKRIISDEMTPHFRNGNYDAGLTAGVTALMSAAKGEYKGSGRTVADARGNSGINPTIIFWVIVLLFILPIILRSQRGGTVYHGGGRRGYGGWGGGGGGWSGGGGGGFSGGGGSSGGGGASGRW